MVNPLASIGKLPIKANANTGEIPTGAGAFFFPNIFFANLVFKHIQFIQKNLKCKYTFFSKNKYYKVFHNLWHREYW